jgi:hypothetical protein
VRHSGMANLLSEVTSRTRWTLLVGCGVTLTEALAHMMDGK